MENYQLFKTTIQLSEGTIQQRFVGRCTREQKLIIENQGWGEEQFPNRKCFNSLRFFMGKRSKKDVNKSQLYLEFIVSNGNVDLCQLKMQRFFRAYRKLCIQTKINKLQNNLLELQP